MNERSSMSNGRSLVPATPGLPTQFVNPNGTPGHVASGGPIESSWGNAVVDQLLIYPDQAAMMAAIPTPSVGQMARTAFPPTMWMWQDASSWGIHSSPAQWVPVAGRLPLLSMYKNVAQTVPNDGPGWTGVDWQGTNVNRFFTNITPPFTDFRMPYPGIWTILCTLVWGAESTSGARAGRLIDVSSGYSQAQATGNATSIAWGTSSLLAFTGFIQPQSVLRIEAACGGAGANTSLTWATGGVGTVLTVIWNGAW